MPAVTERNGDYEEFYQQNEHLYQRLLEEVGFVVGQALKNSSIKIHSRGGRVKDLDHALEKIQRKGYVQPTVELEDIVGYRIVCLFASDLERISDIVKSNFVVLKEEDKVSAVADPATFGYMSNHYICELGPHYSGARYDDLRSIRVEIQCRTILMDAWANVSHHLSYKGDASIPEHLRRDFYALSGLFYVADKHFELFFGSAASSAKRALSKAATGDLDEDTVNVETLQALLQQLYPDRKKATLGAVSELVEEVVPLGLTSIKDLRIKLQDADERVHEREAKRISRGGRKMLFNQVGMARTGLRFADPRYQDFFRHKHGSPSEGQ
jgi:putative GTP pyrophosphokinase